MTSKYRGIVEVEESPSADGQVLVWDEVAQAHKYSSAPTGGGSIPGHVASAPPQGKFPITNLYWNPITNKMVGEYDNLGVGAGNIVSAPPTNCFPVINIYFDPVTGTFQGQYNDEVSLIQQGGSHILIE
jgi:hypothetical protein